MNATVDELLRSFEELAEGQKHELASAVLEWARLAEHPSLESDEFTAAADDIFQGYDYEEAPA